MDFYTQQAIEILDESETILRERLHITRVLYDLMDDLLNPQYRQGYVNLAAIADHGLRNIFFPLIAKNQDRYETLAVAFEVCRANPTEDNIQKLREAINYADFRKVI